MRKNRGEVRGTEPSSHLEAKPALNERDQKLLASLLAEFEAITERGKVKDFHDRVVAALEAKHVPYGDGRKRLYRLMTAELGKRGGKVAAKNRAINAKIVASRHEAERRAREMREHIATYGSPEEIGEERV